MIDQELSTFSKHMICPSSLKNSLDELPHRGEIDFNNYKYRHNSKLFKANSVYTNEILLEKIKRAIRNTCNPNKTPLLLLSDGKDSLSLALAFSKLGIRCHTLTLLRSSDKNLKKYISKVAKELGHFASFVSIDEIMDELDSETFESSFKNASLPVIDQGYMFFLFGLISFFKNNDLNPQEFEIIDGLGNDEYFGYLMSKQQWLSFRISKLGLWKLLPRNFFNLRWYIRSPVESHGDLSALACFFPISQAYKINEYFSKIPNSTELKEYIDLRAFSRGSFHDHQCMMGKTRIAASYLSTKSVFPWLDPELADYCFNIPLEQKLDFKNIVNKLPLRSLLEENIGWNQTKRGVDLFIDLNMDELEQKLMMNTVPLKLILTIKNNKWHNIQIKQRAYLELLNFCGFCKAKNMSSKKIEKLLFGK